MADDNGISELRRTTEELKRCIEVVRHRAGTWSIPSTPPALASPDWNFPTFEKYFNQRLTDLALLLRERYEAQQTGVTAALAAAEKAVNAALIAAEKAVDKAEGAQQLRNEAQNEFRKSLSDLSGLMWTTKEGTAAVEALRREINAMMTNQESRIGIVERNAGDKWSSKDGLAAVDSARRERVESFALLEKRTGALETGYANLQGRIWAVGGSFTVMIVIIQLAMHFIPLAPSPPQPASYGATSSQWPTAVPTAPGGSQSTTPK